MIKISSAKKEDLKDCEKLGRVKEFKEASGDFIDAKFLANYIHKGFFLVAKINRKLVGYLVGEKLRARGAIIWYFAVEKKYRNQGIGDILIKEFEKNCKKNRVVWVYLEATNNNRTKHFYRKEGYSEGEQREEFIKLLGVKRFKDIKF